MKDYVTRLASAGLADSADLFTIAAEQVHGSAVGLFSLPIVLVDIAVGSKAEEQFIAALVSESPKMLVTVAGGDERTVAAMRRIGGEWSLGEKRDITSLERLQSFVFDSTPKPSYEEDGLVEFFSAPGEGRECLEITRRIQQAARDGTRFDEMAIVLRSPQTYTALLESALDRGGIPAYFARGTRRPDASGRALLALLLCAEEGLSAKRFAEYLSLGQVPILDDPGAPPPPQDLWVNSNDDTTIAASAGSSTADEFPDTPLPKTVDEANPQISGMLRAPWKWEELLVEAAVVGGQQRWERRLKGLAAELETKIEALKLEEPDSPQLVALEKEQLNLGHLRQYAMPLIRSLSELPDRATWGGWLTALSHLATISLRRPEHVLSVLADLQPISSVGPVTVNEVREALSNRLSDLSVEPPTSRYGRVFVGTPDQLRGRSFAIVFVPGLAERIFPQKLREDPLLLDSDRQQLAGDPPLLTMRDRAAEERLRLRIAAGSAERKIFFSYPRVEVALARPRVPSFYALDVRRTTLGKLPNVDEFEREAARNSGAELAWLAPENPPVAIDDVEHDLAVLRPLLQADPATVRGGARYLMKLSPELSRSLRARWQRWNKKWSPADGICVPTDTTMQQLAPYRLTERAYSPTSLQLYAACPYRFLLSAIHRLQVREETAPLQTLDPLTRGGIYHAMLARFFRLALAENLFPLQQANLAQASELAQKVVDATATEYCERLAPAIKRVWDDEMELLRADMRGLLNQITEHPDGYLPELIEYGFGLPLQSGRDPASTPEAAILPEGFRLHGVVDLVERSASADRRVTDHKTGKNRTEDGLIVGHGEMLQPVLYSLALQQLLGAAVAEGRLSFCTAAGGYTESTVVMNDAARERAVKVLKIIDQAVETGFLPAAPKENGCKWCDFGCVCGPYEELRVSRKSQTALAKLQELRDMQ
jgi:RecB family exonuclease